MDKMKKNLRSENYHIFVSRTPNHGANIFMIDDKIAFKMKLKFKIIIMIGLILAFHYSAIEINAYNDSDSNNTYKIIPAENSMSVNINTNISVTIMNPTKIFNNDSIVLKTSNGINIPGNISYDENSSTFIYDPLEPLVQNTFYSVKCVLLDNYTWSFLTESLIPISYLLSPYVDSVINTNKINLQWKTNYINSFKGVLFYDVFISYDKTKILDYDISTLIKSNHTDTSIEIGVENHQTYYWNIIPHTQAVIGYSLYGPWYFQVDIIPAYTELLFPRNNDIIYLNTTTLEWKVSEPSTFNIYIDTNKTHVNNYNSTILLCKEYNRYSYNLTGLIDGTLYYWTVIPFNGAFGLCSNKTWSFEVYLDSDEDGVRDSEDAFPLDPTRWTDDVNNHDNQITENSWLSLMPYVIIIIIAVIIFIIVIKLKYLK